ncbi:MAG: 2-amino-3-ketobutyrate coenzyme A ligase [Candidatus Fermentimicrarchaeum limneticum]|jgi:glycine C-acetyltransferase|uniref:2-amino-3-ketobutyrate coenzyme A ligase n=1 Tax=Fermentimicrarchaeum limneticum TaxID=2795018 RepID=A0A7D5XCY6_FERL1|nr:MAG: 2-amino-3-ketobutyrate coenzyme A ligase [Candidatus Fermentimicrarchaeum limneticum]
MGSRLGFISTEIEEMKKKGLFKVPPILSSPQGARAVVNGREVINLSSNSYLQLTTNKKMKKAAIEMIRKYGVGTGAVRQIIGTMDIHEELEKKVANFKGAEAVLMFSSGVAANSGTIPTLVAEGDVVISDELNHGSIIDGVRLTKAERKIYPHLNMEALEKVLKESSAARRRLIITDGVFSMDGDIAPMDRIVELAERYDAITYVDDAHGEGVLGKNGRGIVDHFNLHGRVDVEMGTFSKAFGCMGGYVAGTNDLRSYLIQRARSFLFSTSHPPATVAAISTAIDVVLEQPKLFDKLWGNTKYFRKKLQKLGFNTGNSQTPIIPVITGESSLAQQLSTKLFEKGIYVNPIVYPMVAMDKARVRNIVTAGHKRKDLDAALAAYEEVGRELKLI